MRRRGERKRFSSAILPPWCRKSPKISEVLPLLYLYGLSSGDFVPALEQFLGSTAGLSAATVTRLTQQWQTDHQAFGERDLSGSDYVHVWAGGIHLRIRLREAKSCVLVLMGVRADGTKGLIAMSDGYRESADSWADLLRDCARRGMRAPVLAVGDGALGFWKALAEVFPEARHQRCWVHRSRKESTCCFASSGPLNLNDLSSPGRHAASAVCRGSLRSDGAEAVVAEHRPQHVDPATGEGQNGLDVPQALGSFSQVEVSGGAGVPHGALRGEVEHPAQSPVVPFGPVQVAGPASGVARFQSRPATLVRHPQRGRGHARHRRRLLYRGQVHQPHPVREGIRRLSGRLQRQPGFAGPARAA